MPSGGMKMLGHVGHELVDHSLEMLVGQIEAELSLASLHRAFLLSFCENSWYENLNRPSIPRAIPNRTDTTANAPEPNRTRGELESRHREPIAMSVAKRSDRVPSSSPVAAVAPVRTAAVAVLSGAAARLPIARHHMARVERYPAERRHPGGTAEEVARRSPPALPGLRGSAPLQSRTTVPPSPNSPDMLNVLTVDALS